MTLVVMTAIALADPSIVGGELSDEFHPVGALVAVGSKGGAHFCSGTLIESTWVLTAAHCTQKAKTLQAEGKSIFFMTGTSVYEESGWEDYVEVQRWIPHPRFEPKSLRNDIGLAELSSPIPLAGTLPLNQRIPTPLWEDHELTYVGFGSTGEQMNDGGVKRRVSVPFDGFNESFVFTHDPENLASICFGDSGGPALIPTVDGWVIAGVASHGFDKGQATPGCNSGDPATASTRVDSHRSWIEYHLGLQGTQTAWADNLWDAQAPMLGIDDQEPWSDEAEPSHTPIVTGCGYSYGGLYASFAVLPLLRRRRSTRF